MASFDGMFELSENLISSSNFNQSHTMRSTSGKFPKTSYLYPTLERSGSLKQFYDSSLESITSAGNSIRGKVKRLCSLFDSPKSPRPSLDESQSPTKLKSNKSSDSKHSSIQLPGTEDRIVLYFTSLRGIRRTYDDCCAVRLIFKGFRVLIDERDISMDSGYRKELQSLLGEKNVSLPQVFARGKYIGGAEVIKQLHEVGELAKILSGLPVQARGHVCESCGDVRFIPCMNCNGSRKVYNEDEDQLMRCLECNENGLIRCPTCCS